LLELASLFIEKDDLLNFNPTKIIVNHFQATMILVGSREILPDDSKLLYAKIKKVQPNSKPNIYEDLTNVWLLDSIESDAPQNAIEEIKTFLIS
jgi:hypothetical protein